MIKHTCMFILLILIKVDTLKAKVHLETTYKVFFWHSFEQKLIIRA